MNAQTLGWVMDKDTSTRRLYLAKVSDGVVELGVEVPASQVPRLELDAEGVAALHNLVQQAILFLHDVVKDA